METMVYKETTDDWYPSYKIKDTSIKLVEVAFTKTGQDPKNFKGEWRVCVWGADDCGMERDYQGPETETECWNMFLQVIGLKDVTMKKLKELGFWSA